VELLGTSNNSGSSVDLLAPRASRGHALSKAQQKANRQKSKIRARIEHVFGAQQTSPGGRIVRTIGIMRAKAKIGLQNLAYNIRRLVTLERLAAA
jgi:IS5 family transposase